MQHVSSLMKHFRPFAYCTVCSERFFKTPSKCAAAQQSSELSNKQPNQPSSDTCVAGKPTTNVSVQSRKSNNFDSFDVYMDDGYDKMQPIDAMSRHYHSEIAPSYLMVQTKMSDVCQQHTFAVDTGIVFRALRDYMQACMNGNARVVIGGIGAGRDATPMADRLSCVRKTVSRLLSADDVDVFWRRYREVLTDDRRKLWETLEKSQKEHLRVLQTRDRLDTECEYLRRQNRELKTMIAPYLRSASK